MSEAGEQVPESVAPPAPAKSVFEQVTAWLGKRGKLRDQDVGKAKRLMEQAASSDWLDALTRLGAVSERDVAEALAAVTGIPLVESADYPEEPVINGEVSPRFLRECKAVALGFEDEELLVALANPCDDYAVSALRMALGRAVRKRIGVASEIQTVLERQYGEGKSGIGQMVEAIGEGDEASEDDIEHLKDLASEAPVIRIVNHILQKAVESRASDIHIEPFENALKVRYRIDGVLREVEAPPARSTAAVISRIKIMARLNIAERRLPQDGRIKLRVQGRELDLRVSTVPTLYGESLVLRLLDRENVVLDFESLGFDGAALQRFLEVLELPHGIILVTGPTGSGKTTNLYTALHKINTPGRKIITVEDPVEYQLEGVNQIQVKPQIGLTFASALRSIVRQDPDVIMIGEMRDLETARIAVQSALTGHLVLSTLHTNDAAGGVTRLMDMGVEDYLLTSTVNGIAAQRLVRRLCPHCREPYQALPEMVEELGLASFTDSADITLYHPKGCEHCADTGYQGRMAIVEVLVMTDGIRRLILRHADAGDIEREAIKEGMLTMYQDGLRKAVAGATTVEEIMRVTEAG